MVTSLEDLKPKRRVVGLVHGASAMVLAVEAHGPETVEVTYRTDDGADGAVGSRLLNHSDEHRLAIEPAERPWPLTADGAAFRLASEARRIQLAHLFDPYIAIETATVEPLPHQIEAVYKEMLRARRLGERSTLRNSLESVAVASPTTTPAQSPTAIVMRSRRLIRWFIDRGERMRGALVAIGFADALLSESELGPPRTIATEPGRGGRGVGSRHSPGPGRHSRSQDPLRTFSRRSRPLFSGGGERNLT